jgi:hypothetical protein
MRVRRTCRGNFGLVTKTEDSYRFTVKAVILVLSDFSARNNGLTVVFRLEKFAIVSFGAIASVCKHKSPTCST